MKKIFNEFKVNTMQQWTPGIKINKSNKSKVKNPAKTICQEFFGVITQKSIFFVASMEAKNQLVTSQRFRVS